MSAIASAVASIKALKDLAQTMIGLRDAQAFKAKMIEFQAAILDAQNAAFAANAERTALIERISSLETEMAKVKAWDAEKQKYDLKEVSPNSFAYALKPQAGSSEPAHWICTNCYERGRKSLLQGQGNIYGIEIFRCSDCKAEIKVKREKAAPIIATAGPRVGGGRGGPDGWMSR